MFEAAKHACQENGELNEAQVLLLDFAKAYDSLDREFLFAMLETKGFPRKLCAVVRAIHTDTTIQFMANGKLSEKIAMTSGIRQGCPLAPLLFIIAVDLLYDVISNDKTLRGIKMHSPTGSWELKVAGYADDTAIYLARSRMQMAAISAVKQFSHVSGLQLNVKKSAAINLRGDAEFSTTEASSDSHRHSPADESEQVAVIESTRYLGHIAANHNTTAEAWNKAFDALRIRLALAQTKTNTAQQRAMIAAAIIVPKLLYVARHAWPSEEILHKADMDIKNFVWKSKFGETGDQPTGWTVSALSKQGICNGGLGIPNIRTELLAMAGMTVGAWALTQTRQEQIVGDLLQLRDVGRLWSLIPINTTPGQIWVTTLRATGLPWAKLHFAPKGETRDEAGQKASEIRLELRHNKGPGGTTMGFT